MRAIFGLYLELGGLIPTVEELAKRGWVNKRSTTRKRTVRGGKPFNKGSLHALLSNVVYLGKVKYQGHGSTTEITSRSSRRRLFRAVQEALETESPLLSKPRKGQRLFQSPQRPALLQRLPLWNGT